MGSNTNPECDQIHNNENCEFGRPWQTEETVRTPSPDMGEINRDGHPDLDRFFNLPDLSRQVWISQDGHPDLLKSLR